MYLSNTLNITLLYFIPIAMIPTPSHYSLGVGGGVVLLV